MNVIQFPNGSKVALQKTAPINPRVGMESGKEVDLTSELERFHAELIRLEASVDQLHVTCRNLFLLKPVQK